MLRLVHPGRKGQDPPKRPPKGRHAPALSLTDEEVRHLRVAARNAARAYRGNDVFATVLGVPMNAVYNLVASNGRRPSGTLAIRVARASGMHVEAILSGQLSEAGRCKVCGARIGAGRAAS